MLTIVANLDCEREWARADREVRTGSDREADTSPSHVLSRLAALGSLLRVLASESGDRLWTRAPVDPSSQLELASLSSPRLVSGPMKRIERHDGDDGAAGTVVAWGETPAVEKLRGRFRDGRTPVLRNRPLASRILSLAPASAEAARRANDRAMSAALARDLETELSGACEMRDVAELELHLRGRGASLSGAGRWILKPPHSAAAHGVYHGTGTDIADAGVRRTIERIFATNERLYFEPWVERLDDFGAVGIVGASATQALGFHRLLVDARGRFRGIEFEGSERDPDVPGLRSHERGELESVLHAAGEVLRGVGYTGPFGIDAFRYIETRGEIRFRSLSEINARFTQGLVARLLAEALIPDELREGGLAVAYRVGGSRGETPPGRGATTIELLRATTSGGPWATLEFSA